MNNQISYRSIILTHFLFPLLTAMAMIWASFSFIAWLFPASVGTVNLQLMVPVWFAIYVRNFSKNTLNKLALSQKQVMIINVIASVILISWLYFAFRVLYSPLMSVAWTAGMIAIFLGCEYLGSRIDAWRKKR